MLKHYVAFYVPSEDKGGLTIPDMDREEVIDYVVNALVELAGGCTKTEGMGYWADRSPDNYGDLLVAERVTIIKAFTETSPGGYPIIKNIAQTIKKQLNQHSVAIEIDGAMHFF